ncbi:very short patch repair endonuclease [Candidatus Giovannonibacteria bacterium RIFCSPLOWO2_12_FULL_43_11c]|nr:MAG: very short patch repair endonuclease [Candidatus Giovannonibacteria bacterium RIFCSPHIGHO2_02_FULL_43_32]OGF91955.1 MAG: very short patch repair endonuclease [Candidatus Giovannonibacteria bacterium RIFCSPLOWO2_12_FULL_43_11c]OGI90242.1 MAG: very short patch repair endonuclease [Candidatus Nomurabacteria bacterium RIFCSPLOWO2_01_FULL_41_52b]
MYVRDSRSPKPKNQNTSRIMSANRASDTGPEVFFRKQLWRMGIRGYRKNWKKVPGRPDIAFPSKKVAIFINGCYWHGCSICNFPPPKTNADFWKEKFKNNKKRDRGKLKELNDIGWRALVVWEHDLKRPTRTLRKEILEVLSN